MLSVRLAVTAMIAVLAAACGRDEVVPPATPDGDTACAFHTAADDVAPPPIHTPRWAFRPWISKDISDGADTRAFVQGFADRNIPVGVIVLDSPWETHYNTFVVNPERYPAFPAMVDELHADGIRVVLWITQMVNRNGVDFEPGGDTYVGPSPNYQEARDCGFFVDGGADYYWWKGIGSAIDFFDPDARGWWHRQQDPLYDAGIDGWKLDFGDEYVAGPMVETDAGSVPRQVYSEAYYADFYAYGASRRGRDDFVTMVRPYDRSYGFPGRNFARPEHTPVGWVGDNRRDWLGLADALDHLFRSADAGYAVIGSDIGGYLDKDDEDLAGPTIPFDTLVFARWTALGALNPFMQLHGRANITPWTVPDHVAETVDLYRYWSWLHDELVPFWYSLAEAAHAGGATPMRPIGDLASWAGDYRYMLGDALLVAPILDATGVRDIGLPPGRWYDWWRPQVAAIDGDQTLADVSSIRERIPLYVKEGAIIPATVSSGITGLGTAARGDALTVLIWPATAETSFALVDEDDATTMITAARTAADLTVELARTVRPTYLRIRRDTAPADVTANGVALTAVATDAALDAATTGWRYEAAANWLWVKLAPSATAVTVVAD
jgi:alpha-glucosidase (family GH31 glycosyl hydrolase)